jgi:hypothetical protein
MDHLQAPLGKSLKYARRERERRFLLAVVPEDDEPIRTAAIADRYIRGTRFRLRRSVETVGVDSQVILKLTQKIPEEGGGPGLITTAYLSEAEFKAFSVLPADPLVKTRLSIPPFGVDVFTDALEGLTLAEAEFESDEEMNKFHPPAFAVAEVTQDVRFSGARLATTPRQDLLALLRDFELEPES